MIVIFLIFWGTNILCSVCASWQSHQQSAQGFLVLHIVTNAFFFYNSCSNRCKVITHCLWFVFLWLLGMLRMFSCTSGQLYSLEKQLFRSFFLFFNKVVCCVVFCLTLYFATEMCEFFMYLDSNSLSDTWWFANIFSFSKLPFHFVDEFLAMQKLIFRLI